MRINNLPTILFCSLMIVVTITGYSIAHPVERPIIVDHVKAQAVLEPVPSPTPNICPTATPYDKEIEYVFGSESCNAKRILRWVDINSHLYGENTNFITVDADRQNNNGSWDRGLFRINDRTFAGYLKRLPKLMEENGLSKWDDMLDTRKNIRMAKIIYTYQGWCAWFAAPNSLCSRNYPNVQEM